jgi:hypothetical protein
MNMASGSKESLDFLRHLGECEATDEIYKTMAIDRILAYKFDQVKWVGYFMLLLHIGYMTCLFVG